jgi:hypothetical protein
MNKNLLKVVVYVVGLLIGVGLLQFVDHTIPFQTYGFFTPMGMARFIFDILIIVFVVRTIQFIFRKYELQYQSKTEKAFGVIGISLQVVVFIVAILLIIINYLKF